MLTKDRLIAVRDPHGFRPLALGRLDDAYVVVLGNLRDGSDRRDLRARRRAGRGARDQRRRACARSSRSRRRRSRTASSSTCTSRGPTATCSAGASTKCGPSLGRILAREQPVDADVVVPVPDSGVCAAMGYAEEAGHAAADGAHPQSLRRPHVHPAAAVDPALRREGEAEPGPEHPRRQARRPRRRFDRARHDQPEDREDGARRGRQGSARAHQLSADDLALLLRRRHAAPVGADCARRIRSRRSASTSKPTASAI